MTTIKDNQYWKEYNQKRREYLAFKARERRKKEKESIQPSLNLNRIQPAEQIESIQPNSVYNKKTESIQPNILQPRIQPEKNNSVYNQAQSIQPKEKVVYGNVEPKKIEQREVSHGKPEKEKTANPPNIQITYNPDGTIKKYCRDFENIEKMIEWINSW